MNKFFHRLKQEFSGWQRWEMIYILCATIILCAIPVYMGDTPIGIISAITGTLYTMFAGKGKISCYFFGIINSSTYAYRSYTRGIYGDMMLNLIVYLPMMLAGIIMWKRRLDAECSVIKTALSWQMRLLLLVINIIAILLYAAILDKLDGAQPLVDSTTTVLSITAMILTLKRCFEQWLLWTAVNLLSVIMWFRVFFTTGGASAATLLWWIIMLISGIIFYIQWRNSLPEPKEGTSQNVIV